MYLHKKHAKLAEGDVLSLKGGKNSQDLIFLLNNGLISFKSPSQFFSLGSKSGTKIDKQQVCIKDDLFV